MALCKSHINSTNIDWFTCVFCIQDMIIRCLCLFIKAYLLSIGLDLSSNWPLAIPTIYIVIVAPNGTRQIVVVHERVIKGVYLCWPWPLTYLCYLLILFRGSIYIYMTLYILDIIHGQFQTHRIHISSVLKRPIWSIESCFTFSQFGPC